MTQIILDLTIIVAIVIGLTEVIKRLLAQYFDEEKLSHFIPLLAVCFGVVIKMASINFADTSGAVWIEGIVIGLMSVGLFNTTKETKKIFTK